MVLHHLIQQKWTGVSFNNSQTGDLVCFGSPAYHIGIVIVNSDGSRSMIHAGGGDSSTHGDNPNACVKISSIEPGHIITQEFRQFDMLINTDKLISVFFIYIFKYLQHVL